MTTSTPATTDALRHRLPVHEVVLLLGTDPDRGRRGLLTASLALRILALGLATSVVIGVQKWLRRRMAGVVALPEGTDEPFSEEVRGW